MVGPAGLYLLGALLLGRTELLRGWAIPMATDIAFCYLVARLIFGQGHPAIPFLLLLAIADDAIGLIVLAVFYPQAELHLVTFFLLVGGAVLTGQFMHKRLRLHSFWWYLIPGAVSWYGFYVGGIHPALGLVPIIPTMPHAKTDLGLFVEAEAERHDTLNEFEHWWKYPVEVVLGFFGFLNAGVAFSSVGAGTGLVALGLLVGKPLGITLSVKLVAERALGLQLPRGMGTMDLVVVGIAAGIGFTVALFVSVVAFPPGESLDAVKMGALLSFVAAPLAVIGARLLGVGNRQPPGAAEEKPKLSSRS
jgi:NhaA family Na+:H+ antiporter